MVDHFHEFVNSLNTDNIFHSGTRALSKIDALSCTPDLDNANFLQLYGNYVTNLVNIVLSKWIYTQNASVRSFLVLGRYKKQHFLYFTAIIAINDEWYEVVLEKSTFRNGLLPSGKSSFNRKTRQLIAAIVSRMNVLGSEDDRRIAIPLPVTKSEALLA